MLVSVTSPAGVRRKRGETAREQQPRHGTVWFAPVGADRVPMPVRGLFETPWVGQVAMYAVAK